MTLNEFATQVTKKEGLKKSVSIAQVKEIIKIIRELLRSDIDLYTVIKKTK